MVYALQMYMPNFGDKSELPFIVIGKKDQTTERQIEEVQASQQSKKQPFESKFKPIIPWRSILKA